MMVSAGVPAGSGAATGRALEGICRRVGGDPFRWLVRALTAALLQGCLSYPPIEDAALVRHDRAVVGITELHCNADGSFGAAAHVGFTSLLLHSSDGGVRGA